MGTVLALALVLGSGPSFRKVSAGVEYAAFPLSGAEGEELHVVRVEPARVDFVFGLATEVPRPPQTVGAWARELSLVAAINAGMYQEDLRKNVGYLRDGEHLNSAGWKSAYQSAFAFGPKKKGLPAATMVDLDVPGAKESLAQYRSVVQNLRIIKATSAARGESVWKPNGRKWSESAIALDDHGRVLFLFSRMPLEVADWADRVLALPLGVIRAMHVEGGPEASLFVRGETIRDGAWELPNVVGVRARGNHP